MFVVSIGKAAHSLVEALEQRAGSRFEGIIASSTEPVSQLRGFRYFHSGHPTPNADSVRAAEAMLKSLTAQNAASLVIFLLSGGGSSMAEKPIDDEISLDDLISTYRALVHSGAPIGEINAIRKHLSAIKGGRLALAASPATAGVVAGFGCSRQYAGCVGLWPHHARLQQRRRLLRHRCKVWPAGKIPCIRE